MSIDFLDVDDVLAIHAIQIADHGGSIEIRHMGLLKSAVAQPSMTFGGEFLHGGLFAMAAAYLFHIVMNHPFIDGNKRTGLDAAMTPSPSTESSWTRRPINASSMRPWPWRKAG